ncbi:hypothetical protein FGO68_gene6013 [Halteria grandinella]|uniref:Uncharacterized protein n=1 Tax=Halteria grandinella TaxID=5974 RepID=A0A8J8SX10_HALGN|nr:hypothetical protein FGO68_gene6013 [Halteria grandinella]
MDRNTEQQDRQSLKEERNSLFFHQTLQRTHIPMIAEKRNRILSDDTMTMVVSEDQNSKSGRQIQTSKSKNPIGSLSVQRGLHQSYTQVQSQFEVDSSQIPTLGDLNPRDMNPKQNHLFYSTASGIEGYSKFQPERNTIKEVFSKKNFGFMKDKKLKSKLAQLNVQNNIKLNKQVEEERHHIVEEYKNHLNKKKLFNTSSQIDKITTSGSDEATAAPPKSGGNPPLNGAGGENISSDDTTSSKRTSSMYKTNAYNKNKVLDLTPEEERNSLEFDKQSMVSGAHTARNHASIRESLDRQQVHQHKMSTQKVGKTLIRGETGNKSHRTTQLLPLVAVSLDEMELNRYLDEHKYGILSKKEKKFLVRYVVKGLPESVRGRFWLACSGANSYIEGKVYEKDYYKKL